MNPYLFGILFGLILLAGFAVMVTVESGVAAFIIALAIAGGEVGLAFYVRNKEVIP